ncbi:hypothetical protein DL98DRAFT_512789 [Cadophora sp. DSE1049]|nr:hypothetical protein DL98DRAFT_512789 [Cadophora sp. DSE1049]
MIFLVVGSAVVILICSVGKSVSAWLQSRGILRDMLESWDRLSWESSAALDYLADAGHAGQDIPEEGVPLRDRGADRPAAPL